MFEKIREFADRIFGLHSPSKMMYDRWKNFPKDFADGMNNMSKIDLDNKEKR